MNIVTSNLSDFGYRELSLLEELLQAMRTQGLPGDFRDHEVTPVMNSCSGNVFLSNSEYQVAMLNGDNLESFYSLPYAGDEGFAAELYNDFQRGYIDHRNYDQLADIFDSIDMTDEAEAVRAKLED